MITENQEKIEYVDPCLTRIDPGTKFVIDLKTQKVIIIWKREFCNKVINYMVRKKYIKNFNDVKVNCYGDLLINKL